MQSGAVAPTDRQRARAAPSPPACHRSECASGGRAFVRAGKDRRRCRAMSAAARWPPAPWPHDGGVRRQGGGCAGEEDGGALDGSQQKREWFSEKSRELAASSCRKYACRSPQAGGRAGAGPSANIGVAAPDHSERCARGRGRKGEARHGTARHGKARHGTARQGRRGGTYVPRFLSCEAPRRRCCRSRTRSSASSARAGR